MFRLQETNRKEPPNSTTWRKRRSFSTRLHFIHFLCRFLSPFPKEFPQSTLSHERTRAHTHHLLTAGVASSSSSLSHHHHHHAHVCGKLCQNAVLDVKSPCFPIITGNNNLLGRRRRRTRRTTETTTTTLRGKRGSISIVPRSDNGAYPHTLSTAIKDPITPHGPRFYEYGGFDIDPELQHNRKAYINERIDTWSRNIFRTRSGWMISYFARKLCFEDLGLPRITASR